MHPIYRETEKSVTKPEIGNKTTPYIILSYYTMINQKSGIKIINWRTYLDYVYCIMSKPATSFLHTWRQEYTPQEWENHVIYMAEIFCDRVQGIELSEDQLSENEYSAVYDYLHGR